MAIEQTATQQTPIEVILSAGSAVGLSDSQLVENIIRGRDDARELSFLRLAGSPWSDGLAGVPPAPAGCSRR